MDDRRFDVLTKALAGGSSRRSILKGLLGFGGALTTAGVVGVDAARRPAPTPKPVSCPGQQFWDGAECVCPNDLFECGPDCCGSSEQCCDNACCPYGSVCIAEEQCCPVGRVCPSYPSGSCCPNGTLCCPSGDSCFDPAGGCCDTSDCPTDDCNPVSCENNVCVYQPLTDGTDCGDCAACSGGVCVSTCNGTCCPADDACVDLANGGCCSVDDCPARDCHSVTCEEHICVYQSFADGTDCGDCQECTGGACTYQCATGETCCTGTDTCVDLENGGCCGDADCPPDPAPCVATCSDHQCRPSDSVACETLDGGVCCAYGETCAPFSAAGQSANFCCEPATTPCFDGASVDVVCCGGSNSCQDLTITTTGDNWLCQSNPALCQQLCAEYPEFCQTLTFPICCPGDTEVCYGPNVAASMCCGVGQTCNQVTTGGLTVGQCCDTGTEGCYDFAGSGGALTCCGAGEACKTNSEAGQEIQACCPASADFCRDSTGNNWACCGQGNTCKPVTSGNVTVEYCCPSNAEACFQPGMSSFCCAVGQTCQQLDYQGVAFGQCCDSGTQACAVNTPAKAGDVVCCGSGKECRTTTINGIDYSDCCPATEGFCMDPTGLDVICCGNGSTCQTTTGDIIVEICCPSNTKPCLEPGRESYCCPV